MADIQVQVSLGASPDQKETVKASVYAFTTKGRFLTQAPVDEKGNAVLKLPNAKDAQELRILVGPELNEKDIKTDDDEPSLFAQLTRRAAPERLVRLTPELRTQRLAVEIPWEIWRCWLRFCLVRGTLLKRVRNSGVTIDYPVCNATVKIWEVDRLPWIVGKLTDIDLDRFRKYLLNPQPLPPGPDPDPFKQRFDRREIAKLGELQVAEAEPTQLAALSVAAPELDSLHRIATRGSLADLRRNLLTIDTPLLRNIFCLLYPGLVTKQLIGTVTTDHCGRFQRWILAGCTDAPDLYFTATSRFFGITFNIYQPTPVPCYTYWNYQCGSEVTLFTTSPFAQLCPPCEPIDAPENYVLFRALGNVQLNRIFGANATLASTPANVGKAADLYGIGLHSPFGGTVLPRVEFDSSLRANNRAMYYRISYREGTSGAFIPCDLPVHRAYNHFVGADLVTASYNLGPKVVGATPCLFEIPPAVPPLGDWVFPNPPVDHANAVFETNSGPVVPTDGKYQLKLELFDAAGAAVNIAAAGIRYFVPSTVDADGTIHTTDAATLGLVSGNSFIMTVHVDNRPTTGSLGTPTLNGLPADECGVFKYGAGFSGTVQLPFVASHPDNLATYSYSLTRGATLLTSINGPVSAATNPGSLTRTAIELLTQADGSICPVAGFAEDLYVTALATDGWSRLSDLDSNPGPRAFVLAPETEA
jgi:hypothetical protein